ncbi:hypothetical protein LCGC14_0313510 [marine sediment metagenome]|uniref:Uncharacterized protein n=1 Tax=marine sediment metagenome TaxID=412755 RepID=A0A0F9TRW7_9ZZZZ
MIAQRAIVRWKANGTITVANGKWSKEMPYAGEIIEVGGYMTTLGSGGGTSTDFQLRNETDGNKDILSTVGAFEVDSGTKLLEGQVVDTTNASFAKDDVIDLDADAISTNPADAEIWAVVVFFMDDV